MGVHPLLTILAVTLVGLVISTAPSVAAGKVVAFRSDAVSGTVIVRTGERKLYLVLGEGRALRYSVGVGRPGRQWAGTVFVEGKHLNPNWAPPAAVRVDRPNLPDVIPGGSPSNPMGVAALTLSGGEYAIHGTNAPNSIGGFVSYGCIRMFNQDITELFGYVHVGTQVLVTP